MQKRLLPFLSLLLVIWGCGEAGIQSDISKDVGIDPINVNIPVIPGYQGDTPTIPASSDPIDISDNEFSEYIQDSESFTINKITFTLEDYDQSNEADLEIEINVSIAGGADLPLLTTTIADLQTISSSDIQTLFSKSSPGNVNTSTITQLEQALQNGQSFQMDMNLTGRNVSISATNSEIDFNLYFKFDVTARLQLD